MSKLIKEIVIEVLAIAVGMVALPYLGWMCYKAYFGKLSNSDIAFFRDVRLRLRNESKLGYIVQAVVLAILILCPTPVSTSLWYLFFVLWVIWACAISFIINHIAIRGIYQPLK